MSKTLVNIITEDNPIPAYLFIKEKYEVGDRLMYISAKDTEDDLDALSELFNVPAMHIEEIVLKNDADEFTYEKICRTVIGGLDHETHYCVNLAGGTRYMALAVQQVFERFDSEFFYVETDENIVVQSVFDNSIYDNDDHFFPIHYRMTIAEYLKAHEIQHDLKAWDHEPIRSEDDAKSMFNLFAKHLLTQQDYDVIELLRMNYRNRNRININNTEEKDGKFSPAVPGLKRFLYDVEFVPEIKGTLLRREIEYLTGGWFEEYVYYMIKKHVCPQDIAISITISRKNVRHTNELDVVFTKGNKLFVIECKTGVQSGRLFNEIVYKVCAVREALLGVSCYSYIFSLKKDDSDVLKRIAENMDITFVDHDILTNPRKNRLALLKMNIQAKDNTP